MLRKLRNDCGILGAKPTIQPSPIFVGNTLEEMLKNDAKAEEETIAMYKEIMQLAEKEGDVATKEIFEEIEEDEEEHHDFFTAYLKSRLKPTFVNPRNLVQEVSMAVMAA